MDVVGIGVDLVDVQRVQRMLDRHPTFAPRVFTPQEIEYCDRQGSPAESYAARWAAREACRKALGGVRGMRWHEVRVDRAPTGAPALALSGNVARRAAALGVTEVKVALTHERRMAAAFCVAVTA
ncbi:MAG TPA: holo-ACP synthase [Actinomycetota bacterium]|jgi:holo-[acyl-carrier protein] synthase